MNKKILTVLSAIFLAASVFGQAKILVAQLNFGFEKTTPDQPLPDNWMLWGKGYKVSVDTITRHRGKNALLIKAPDHRTSGTFGCVAYKLPATFDCREIELRAYLKTQNVTGGKATLMLRIDPASGHPKVVEMKGAGIHGTTEWTRYSVKLAYPEDARYIFIGATLHGKGQLWADDFEILVDGQPIMLAKLKESKANKDKEFDAGSKVAGFIPSAEKIEDLKVLGLVWGFLKYYHPNIAAGNFNWDYELFRVLPLILEAKNSGNRDQVLSDLIKRLGDFELGKEPAHSNKEVKIKPDLDWILNSNLSPELTAQLLKIKSAKRSLENFYIGLYNDAENPEFKNEKAYYGMNYPDTGFRLLSLYRYWNMIQYFFPYKYLIEEDWKDVLSEFIPKYCLASNEIEYQLTVLELVVRICDSHASLTAESDVLYNYRGRNYSSALISFVENKAVVTGFERFVTPEKYELNIGDVILSVQNKPVETIIKDKWKYTSASNDQVKLRNIGRDLLRTSDSLIHVEVERDGVVFAKDIKAYPLIKFNFRRKYPNQDTCFKMIRPDIGYLFPGIIKNKYLPEIMKEVKNKAGLIIDLRCYPSEFIILTLGKYLLPDSTPTAKYSIASITNPGLFEIVGGLQAGEKNEDYYKGKVVILVNESTQSQAEHTSMSLRLAPKAVIVGSTTAGADGDVSEFDLPGGLHSRYSGIGWYYADGSETQRVGIVPDVEIRPTIHGIRTGRDELIEKAIEIIRAK